MQSEPHSLLQRAQALSQDGHELAMNLLGSFDFAMGLVPQVVEAETSLWIWNLESHTGLHRDIEPSNLLLFFFLRF